MPRARFPWSVAFAVAMAAGASAVAQRSPSPTAPVVPSSGMLHPLALGEVGHDCSTARFVAQAGERCTPIAVTAATPALAHAFDRDGCTVWNSGGFAPQTLEGRFASPQHLSGLILVPDMTPAEGDASHILELSTDGSTFDRAYTLHSSMRSGRAESVAIPDGTANVLAFRIRTVASPSWIAWREVVPITCAHLAAPTAAPATTSQVPTGAEITPGRGSCRVDSDCVGATCCHPTACVARSVAPACSGMACTRSCSGPMDCGRGGCLCRAGRCASWTAPAARDVLVPGEF